MTQTAQASLAREPENEVLHRLYLTVDGNAHRDDLCRDRPGFSGAETVSEALLPQIRTVACLIAAARHDWNDASPEVFTEEADWFAARILVLHARVFYLDVSLLPMLRLANARARKFARRHGLPFVPARARMSICSGRPANMLVFECPCPPAPQDLGLVGNSAFLRDSLASFRAA